ncbi:uncharacterized protein [Amphiura filiformis]|uniref:uncharacterized protein n=1 Tax=Amphiura filiformis TaxID=82378 RepID=UPI003B21BE06
MASSRPPRVGNEEIAIQHAYLQTSDQDDYVTPDFNSRTHTETQEGVIAEHSYLQTRNLAQNHELPQDGYLEIIANTDEPMPVSNTEEPYHEYDTIIGTPATPTDRHNEPPASLADRDNESASEKDVCMSKRCIIISTLVFVFILAAAGVGVFILLQNKKTQNKGEIVNEPPCVTYNHPNSGCTGRCMPTSSCPNGTYKMGLCPPQGNDITCCFTADTDLECATKDGNCISSVQCPSTPLSGYCPSKPTNVKCCFDKPTDTCSGRDYVPYACLHCICMAESNCKQLNPICHRDVNTDKCGLFQIKCHQDVNTDICGPYQIKEEYYIDAKEYASGVLGGDYKSCTATFHCSEQAVHAYMKRYATSSRLGHAPTCEDFARIHNGGPNGHLNNGTLQYWNNVKTCLENL